MVTKMIYINSRPKFRNTFTQLISGFHCALLQSITFIIQLNAPDYTKLRG